MRSGLKTRVIERTPKRTVSLVRDATRELSQDDWFLKKDEEKRQCESSHKAVNPKIHTHFSSCSVSSSRPILERRREKRNSSCWGSAWSLGGRHKGRRWRKREKARAQKSFGDGGWKVVRGKNRGFASPCPGRLKRACGHTCATHSATEHQGKPSHRNTA